MADHGEKGKPQKNAMRQPTDERPAKNPWKPRNQNAREELTPPSLLSSRLGNAETVGYADKPISPTMTGTEGSKGSHRAEVA